MAAAAERLPAELILTMLINDLDDADGDLALVLDDYHLINNPAVHSALAFLLDNCPRAFHLVIAARSDPQLPLARLRARSKVVELRAADLRFTEPEADRFFNTIMGLELDHQSVAILEERSEGWIAGLQMAALSIQGRPDVRGFVEKFAGTNRFIMDFMMEEVLAREPEEIQDLLAPDLHSHPSERTIVRCRDRNQPAGGECSNILKTGTFLLCPWMTSVIWYRYHHLFADLLQGQIVPDQVRIRCRAYSNACGPLVRSSTAGPRMRWPIPLFRQESFALAAGLIIKYWPLLTQNGEIETVWPWLNALPEEIVRHSAPLSVAFCWLLVAHGAGSTPSNPTLADAKRALENAADIGATDGADPFHGSVQAVFATLPAEMAALRSFVTRHQNDFDTAARFAEQALRSASRRPTSPGRCSITVAYFHCPGIGDRWLRRP